MAVRYICDRCGETDVVGRFAISTAVSSPHSTGNHLPKFDGELCRVCLDQISAGISEVLKSKRK